MKKTILTLMLALVLCVSIPALAMGWAYTPDPVPEYTVTVTKLDRVQTTTGTAYTPAPDKLAMVGQVVYFSVRITDNDGNDVKGDIRLGDLEVLYIDGNIIAATVTGAHPTVTASIETATPADQLVYNGKLIIIAGNTVTIDKLEFQRRNNVAVSVDIADGNLGELSRALAALGMTIEDVYSGRIYMSDAALIANFGQRSRAETTAKWYADADAEVKPAVPDLPQTGDKTGIVGFALIAAAVFIIGVKKWVR
jgi:hypothetical protein